MSTKNTLPPFLLPGTLSPQQLKWSKDCSWNGEWNVGKLVEETEVMVIIHETSGCGHLGPKFQLEIHGACSGFKQELHSGEIGTGGLDPTELNEVRDTILKSLADQCRQVQSLKIRVEYEDQTDEGAGMNLVDEPDNPWAHMDSVLHAFDRAGHWTQSLQKLHLDVFDNVMRIDHEAYKVINPPQKLSTIQVQLQYMSMDPFINNILRAFPSVQVVDVFNHEYMQQAGDSQLYCCLPSLLKDLHQDCPNIHTIKIRGALHMDWDELTNRERATVLNALQGLSNLKHFAYLASDDDGNWHNQSRFVKAILKVWPKTNIEHLEMPCMPCELEYLDGMFENKKDHLKNQCQDLGTFALFGFQCI